jgi:ATP-binding cassette, subfamily B, multidrug efflux pump
VVKSTLINLIPRFYDVTNGSILVNGVDIRKVNTKVLRDVIGYIPQKGVLLSGTVLSNINFGKEDASIEEVNEAIRVSQSDFC